MKITTWHIADVLVVDMFGDFPRGSHETDSWRASLESALEGHSGHVILQIRDARSLKSIHMGIMIGTVTRLGIRYHSVSFVTPDEELLSVLRAGHYSLFSAYETLNEALRPPRQPNLWENIGAALLLVGFGALVAIPALLAALWFYIGRLYRFLTR